MRKMKDSGINWIGLIPSTWDVIPLFSSFYEGKNKNTLGNENNLLSLSYGKIVRKNINSNEGLLPENYYGYNIVEKGDIIIRPTDLQNDKRSLRTGLVNEKGIITSAYIDLKPHKDINSSYYHYLLHSYDLCKVFYNMGNGVRQGINYSVFCKLPVLLPTESEQVRIVNFLDAECLRIDTIIEKQKTIIDKLKNYRLSIISEAVTKGINPNANLKDCKIKNIGQIPSSWEVCSLFFVTHKIGDGLHGSPEFDDSGDCYFINGNNLGKDTIEIKSDTKKTSSSEYEKYKLDLDENTLLISLNGTIGNLSRYKGEKIVLGKSAGYIKLNSSLVTIDYLKYYLQSISTKTMFEISLSGTTIGNLSLETLRNLPVCIMSLEEQNQITNYLNLKCLRIDKTIELRQQEIEKLSLYKKSLIYEVVTGKKEV